MSVVYSNTLNNFIQSMPELNAAAAAAKSLQSCPTLCDLIDGSPPGSSVPGIFQAKVLECSAIAFSKAGVRRQQLTDRVRMGVVTIIRSLSGPMVRTDSPGETSGAN